MKLIAKDAAIAAITVVSDEFKPQGGYYLPELLRSIAERYELAKVPSVEDAKNVGAVFQNGHLTHSPKPINIVEFGLFNDAIRVTATDTVDCEVVLDDLLNFLKQSFGFRDQITEHTRVFQSDLIVEFDNDPDKAFRFLGPLIEFLQMESKSFKGFAKALQFNRLGFGADPSMPGFSPEFGFERRIGVPWSANRYFCKAHLRTGTHIRALEMFDEMLAGMH